MDRFYAKDASWTAVARGVICALGALLLLVPLGTAAGVSFDILQFLGSETLVGAVALVAFFAGGWVAMRSAERPLGVVFVGGVVWCVTSLVILHFTALGFELPGFSMAGGDGAVDSLLPFSRNEAWMQVAGNLLSLASSLGGAWTGAHVGVRRPSFRFAPHAP